MNFVIVGAGLAGAKAAQALREEGFGGNITLIGQENERPYERPPLSKGLLLGGTERDSVYVHEAEWYAANNVDLRKGVTATGLDAAAKQLTLSDGTDLGYDKLLLTTGSSPRRLAVPGSDLDGVLYLRTLEDSDRINSALTSAANVVIIGAGWIGLEIAAAARQRGGSVHVVEVADLPLQRVLGDEIATVFADLHREHGVVFHFGAQVESLRGNDSGAVTSVVLADDTRLQADVVVVGVGIQPNVKLAQDAGLNVDNGIVVDASLRSSDPNIFAAGDVANAYHPLLQTQIRVEHWANALNEGPAAAKAMLGQEVSYDLLPYFYTDQYDLGMEYSGYVAPGGYDRVVVRGNLSKREFIAFWIFEGRVLAGMNVNIWDVTDPIQDLVRSPHAVDLVKLADPEVPLTELLG